MVNVSVPNVNGTTFGKKAWSVKPGQRVWREIRHRFPAGGTISNLADWKSAGIIPSGTPCEFDNTTYAIKALTAAQAKTATKVSGFLQEDIVVDADTAAATGTVIYAGEIYEYMFD